MRRIGLFLVAIAYSPFVYCAQCLPEAANPSRNIFIIAGQSNAAGLAETSRAPSGYSRNTIFNEVQIYGIHGAPVAVLNKDNAKRYSSVDWSAEASWGPAQPGYGSKDLDYYRQVINPTARAEDLNTLFGAELAFADLLSRTPPYEHYLVKLAIGGTTLAPKNEDVLPDWAPDSYLFRELLEMIADAYNAKRASLNLKIAGLFWMQGESDALDAAQATHYQTSLVAFVEYFRASLAEMGCRVTRPDFPVVVGRIQDNVALPFRHLVRNAQEAAERSVTGVSTLNTDTLQRIDQVHFGGSGQAALGTLLYYALSKQGVIEAPADH